MSFCTGPTIHNRITEPKAAVKSLNHQPTFGRVEPEAEQKGADNPSAMAPMLSRSSQHLSAPWTGNYQGDGHNRAHLHRRLPTIDMTNPAAAIWSAIDNPSWREERS